MLVREFHLSLSDIFDLTPRQIQEVYFGTTEKSVNQSMDTAARLQQIIAMVEGGLVKATPEKLAELKRRAADGH